MIEWIIRRSVANRFLVMMAALFLSIWGTWTIIHTPVDALPDLSDVQVIVKTRYPGQAPQIVENQVTWPLTTTMLSVRVPSISKIHCLQCIRSSCCAPSGPLLYSSPVSIARNFHRKKA